jgi:hypothetical protein
MTVVSSWVCGKLRASNEMDKEITKKVEEVILFYDIGVSFRGTNT